MARNEASSTALLQHDSVMVSAMRCIISNMDTGTWIGIAGLVIALAAAAGTAANAIITHKATEGAQRDATEARATAEKAVAETKRIADATEERVRLLREQLEEERERAKPNLGPRAKSRT